MIPDQEDHADPEMTPRTASTMQKIASVLGLVAGVLFLVAFGLNLARSGDVNWFVLVLGLFFLGFPLLMKRFLR
jgi:hypothetical protein